MVMRPPFFKANQCSLVHQFTVNVPLMCPYFLYFTQIFPANFAFSALFFTKILALKTQIFRIFVPKTPHFYKENLLPIPYFWKPARYTQPPKKSVECQPPIPPPAPWPQPQLGNRNECLFERAVLCQQKLLPSQGWVNWPQNELYSLPTPTPNKYIGL